MLKYFSPFCLLLITFNLCNCQNNMWMFSDKVIQYFMGVNNEPSSMCEYQINEYLMALNNKEKWAATMIDSTTKLQSGLFSGNLIDFGQYDQCLSIEHNSDLSGIIRGKHCMVYAITQNFQEYEHRLYEGVESGLDRSKLVIGFGVCLPASCSGPEIRNHVQEVVRQMDATIANYDPELACNTIDDRIIDPVDAVAIVLFGITITAIILSTSYDLVTRCMLKDKHFDGQKFNDRIIQRERKWLLIFSVRQNCIRLFSEHEDPQEIKCLHGLRVLCLAWVMIGHRYMLTSMFPVNNSIALDEWVSRPTSALILSAQYSVDTFLVISGMLTCRSYFKNTRVSTTSRYIHRYIRLTAPFVPVVLLGATTSNLGLGSGPNWKAVARRETQNCRNFWWSALLHIQNYVNPDAICIGQSWYLSLDAQLFLISPLLMASLKRWPKRSIFCIVLLVIVCITCISSVAYLEGFSASTLPVNPQRQAELYLPTYARASPWLLGIILGILMHKYESSANPKSLCKHVIRIFWILSIVTVTSVILCTWILQQEDFAIWSMLHLGLSRPVWAGVTCWLIYVCHVGKGGVINRILSHRAWKILSRLSFCMYLLHLQVQLTVIASMRAPQHFSNFTMIYSFWGDCLITFLLSLAWSLAFESPIMNIENIFLQRKQNDIEMPISVINFLEVKI